MALDNWPNLMELGSNLAILEAVQRNLGVGVLSEYAARDWLALGRVAVVRLQRCRTSRRFYAVWRHRKPLPLPAQLFLNLLFPSRRYKRSTSQANAG
jgi:DNA-binding transcriptional LysR family regulator